MNIAGVLLAAGGGTRFAGKTHKLLAKLGRASVGASDRASVGASDTKPIRVVDQALATLLAARFEQTAVVTGAVELWPHTYPPAHITVLHNPDWEEGIATSLQVAIRWARARALNAIVVGLADQPFISAKSWQDVAAAVAQDASSAQSTAVPLPIAVATYDGVPGNPVGLRREAWHLLPSAGDQGARSLIRSQPELCTAVACDGNPSDIDTVEDLRRWI